MNKIIAYSVIGVGTLIYLTLVASYFYQITNKSYFGSGNVADVSTQTAATHQARGGHRTGVIFYHHK